MTAILEEFQKKFPRYAGMLDDYADCFSTVSLPAGSVLVREGEISRHACFVESGCARMWLSHRGKELTFQFVFENQGVSSVESFLNRTPGMFTVETIEPTVVTRIGKTAFDRIASRVKDDPAVLREVIRILFSRQFHYMNELLSFIRDTPTERYRRLLAERPHIVERVPQRYIASYLGVSAVHLSRIRAAVAREGKS
jgi:CRP-like cAMP-binding protein